MTINCQSLRAARSRSFEIAGPLRHNARECRGRCPDPGLPRPVLDAVVLITPLNLLFVCTGNSCRSQMAEAWTRVLARDFALPGFVAASAGLEAHGLNPGAVAAMAEFGVDIRQQQSKLLSEELLDWADIVVTVCSHADSHCPLIPLPRRKIHLPFDDPAQASGSDAAIRAEFNRVCTEIRDGIQELLGTLSEQAHRQAPLDSLFAEGDFQLLDRRRIHQGFVPLDVLQLRHRLYRGGWSETLERELAVRSRAVGVLLYDPDLDQVVLVRQFRAGLVDEAQSPWNLEVVAGMAAVGEAMIDVVQREALEETHCRITQLLPVCEYYNSPGWSNEKISLFCGRVDASSADGVHGLDAEHEDILVLVLGLDDAVAAVRSGNINNAMAIIAIQWLELNREQVRIQWMDSKNH